MLTTLLCFISLALLIVVVAVNRRMFEEKEILRKANEKLEQIHKDDQERIKRYHKMARIHCDTLRDVATECHGVIGAGTKLPNDDMIGEWERSIEAILTECHAALGNDVSGCFASIQTNEQRYYAANPVNHTARWSERSVLQAKQAAEKKLRKAENKPGVDKFTIDDESEEARSFRGEQRPPANSTVDEIVTKQHTS